MRTDRLLFIIIFLTVVVRFLWATLTWPGEFYLMFPVFISLIALLIWYYLQMESNFYKMVLMYFILFIIGIFLHLFEIKIASLVLFLGSIGFLLFSGYVILKRKNSKKDKLFFLLLSLSVSIIFQTILYLFFATSTVLLLAHSLSFVISGLALAIVFRKEVEKVITIDEKNILSFIIIVNILSLLGVTFNASFYSSLWI
jgi:hypothetical protein